MAAGKSRRSKQKRKPSGNASTGDLLEQVRQLLASGDGRGALDRLKQAKFEDGKPPEELPVLRFCACIERARQLARSGLDKEAAAMHGQAAQHRTAIPTAALAEKDLALYLRHLDGADVLAVYGDYLKVQPPARAVERALADRLVVHRCWEGVEGLEPDHPLRRDAGPVQASLGAMDAGDWARAAECLQGVSRRSPFAPWRVFCKAMKCFGDRDDAGLARNLDVLPADFLLAGTVAEWRRVCGRDSMGGPVPVRRALGTDGAAVQTLADDFSQALRTNGRTRAVERLVIELADALYPEEPLRARIDLLLIAGMATLGGGFSMKNLVEMVRRLLPQNRCAGMGARLELAIQQLSPGRWDPTGASALLKRLETEFPRPADRVLVRGRVLEALARTGHMAVRPEDLSPRAVQTLSELLNGRADDPGMLFPELMAASLEADPSNREGYRFLLDLLRGRASAKRRMRATLEAMAKHFPEDLEPWLELATLHYSMNAYRRAETALAEARQRAPHDERTLDLLAVGFLKSADQSRKSGRFELAAKDLRRAEEMRRPRFEDIIQVKRIFLDVVSGAMNAAEVAGIVTRHLAGLSLAAQMRTLAVLRHDLEENRHVKNVSLAMAHSVKALLAEKIADLDELTSDQRIDLLVPLPADLHVLYDRRHIAPVLTEWWPDILERQEGDGLLAVFDLLMDCGGSAAVRVEIGHRLRRAKTGHRDPVLLLYLAVIRYRAGDDYDSRRFTEALDAAGPGARERLREISARLTRFTRGLLCEALQKFDFSLLDAPPLFDKEGPSVEDVLDAILGAEDGSDALSAALAEESGAEEHDGPPLDELMEALRNDLRSAASVAPGQMALFGDAAEVNLRTLEAILDRVGLRGHSADLLRRVARIVRTDAAIRRNLDALALQCREAGLGNEITPEARAFLFPDRRQRRGR